MPITSDTAIIQLADASMAVTRLGSADEAGPELIWVHGWGQSGAAFMELARSFARDAASAVVDLPGFGNSPLPPAHWGTADYGDAIAGWIATLPPRKRIWIAHSYGCRVGIQLAARHPGLLAGMVLIAAAGLPRHRTLIQTLRLKARIYAFKLAKRLTPAGAARERLYAKAGSADARNAGAMRPILIRAVNENLTEEARKIGCPTLLVYGRDDDDTPPEIGERLNGLIAGSELLVLNGFDHHTILTAGMHQLVSEISRFRGQVK
jgi:pimeloyl-ACP methyl ester carboxylesterase